MDLIAQDIKSKAPVKLSFGEQFALAPSLEPASPNLYLSKGWVDIQVNGFAGFDMNTADISTETVRQMVKRLWQEGVTTVFPTVITGPTSRIKKSLATIAEAVEKNPDIAASIAGIHLEGPYISPQEGARGAHPLEDIHAPDRAEFESFQEAARGLIKLVTLAPEHEGSEAFIRYLTEQGIVVALGHTVATTDVIQMAVAAGARLSTHLANGAPAMLRRHPNFIWDQLAEDRLYASAIFDGHHLPQSVMKVLVKVKGSDRLIITSDAVALAKMPSGIYETTIGGKVELAENGRLTMYGTDYLAGSASSLKDCLEVCIKLCGLEQSIKMVTETPKALLKLASEAYTVFQLDHKTRLITVIATIVGKRINYFRLASK